MLAGGLRPLPGRLVTDSRSALGARRARPLATPFAQQHLKFHGPPNSGRSVAEWAPSLKKATGASRPSLQQRLPGAEGPPEGRSTAPRHAACGGPIPSWRSPVLICVLAYSHDGRVSLSRPHERRLCLGPRRSMHCRALRTHGRRPRPSLPPASEPCQGARGWQDADRQALLGSATSRVLLCG